MKIVRRIVRLFFAAMVGLALGTCLSLTQYTTSYKPYVWNSPPILVNCYGPELTESKMQSAVDFWSEYGDEVAFILQDPPESVCKHNFVDGFIILKKVPADSLNNGVLAQTKTKYQFLKIRAATIYFEPGTYRIEWLTEHELGHAFGYKHIDELGHIMNPFIEFQDGKYWIP